MKSNKVTKKIISFVVSISLVISSALSTSLIVFASSGGGTVSGSFTGGASGGWCANNDDQDIIKISASKINDNTTNSAMANMSTRYGDLHSYPIFMMSGSSVSHAGGYGADANDVINNLKNEANKWKDKSKYTTHEYYEDKLINYTSNTDNNYSKSVYIEDCLITVYDAYKNGTNFKLSSVDVQCFWYFYTRLAKGVNTDHYDVSTRNGSSALGDKLSDYITKRENGFNDKEKHSKMMQHGYEVALAAIYGINSTPIKNLTGEQFKSQSDLNFGGAWKNGYKSILVDRMAAISYKGIDYKIAFTPYDYLYKYNKYYNLIRNNNIAQEHATFLLDHTNLAGKNFSYIALTFGGQIKDGKIRDIGLAAIIYPKREQGNDTYIVRTGLSNDKNNRLYGGWGYFPLESSDPLDKKIDLKATEETRIATEVTYNAYLTDKDKNVDFAEQAKFGANSHVMTDTVYYSDMYDISHLYKSGDNAIKDNKYYLTTTVDKSIKLSAPVEQTTYNLYRMQYQITNAGGENSSFNYKNSNEKTRTLMENNSPVKATESELNNSTIYVRGSDINYATGDWVNGVWKPSEFRLRVQKDKGDALSLGKYTYGNNQTGTYNVYLYGRKNGENKKFRLQYKDNGNWKGATTEQIADYVKGKNYEFRLNDNSGGYSMGINKNKGANFGTFDANDIDGNSLNVFVVETSDDGKSASFVCKKNGGDVKFTYCPLAIYRNLLVQIKADYIATFAEKLSNGSSNSNYNNTFKEVDIPAYLLAQNTSSDDFTKKTMYTMLDMYNTTHWGTLTHASFTTYADDGSTITLPVTSSSNSGSEYYGNTRSTFRNYEAITTLNTTFIKKGTSLSGKLRKVSYMDGVSKDVPMFGTVNFRLDRGVITKVRTFDSTNNLKSGSTETEKDGKIYWTQQKGTDNYSNQIKSKVADSIDDNGKYLVPAEGDVITWGECNNANMTAYNDGHGGQKTGISYDTPSGNHPYVGNYSGIGASKNSKSTYIENYFTKVLTHYVKYNYRSKAGTATAPALAKWMSASMSGFDSDIKPKAISATSIKAGFLRFGQVAITDGYAGAEELDSENNKNEHRYKYYTVKNILTIGGIDKGIRSVGMTSIDTYTGLSKSLLNTGSTYDGREFTFAAPITQSAYDIPLKYNLRVKTGENKDKQAFKTYYKKNGKTISMFYQYSAENISNGLYKFGGDSTNWKYNKVSIGVYPEVRMWAEKDFTNNSSKHKPTSASDYNAVATVGTRMRYVPAATYTTLDFGGLNVDAQVMGTAVAYDTRAKKLAQSLGTADTQVIYSGTAVNGTITSKASGTLKTYALDFRGGGVLNNQDIKTGWKNNNYDSKSAASKAMSVVLDQFKVNSSANMAIYNGKTLTNVDVGISSTTGGDLSASSPVNGNVRYNLYIRGSQIYQVIVYTRVGNNYVEAIRYRFMDPDGNNERGGYTKLVETGTNKSFWYNTGSCKIKAVNGKYIYNGTTELTATEKANYLAIYNGNPDVTKSTFTNLRTLLTNMRLYGNYNVLANTFEYNTGVDLPNGLKNSTGGTKSYNEDCSVLQIREYTATVTSGDSKSTFTEQIPINAGPSTPIDKNMYFSNGYKAFVNASVKVVAKNDLKNSTDDIIIAKNTVFASDVVKHKVKGSTTEVVVDNASKAKTAIPDFIIGDVPISEALSG